MAPIHISLKAENISYLLGIPISNSLITTWLVMIFLILLSMITYSKLTLIPGYLQLVMEMLIGGLHSLFKEILEDKVDKYFPYLITIFIFIIFLNWSGILPGVGTIGIYVEEEEFIPFFRAGTADLNMTFALALLTVIYVQYAGISSLGIKYLSKFFNITNPLNFVVGILELISEISRVISFAFRLFGNIFAGEVLLTVIGFLVPLLAPIPFLGLELFVGFIQALVFAMLSAVFFTLATAHAEH
ncbi:ATP synthase F0 subunit A [Candidatus Gottesmanbacteria bacterium RIFCSPHIGHO2_02_FULL_39_14]|uniref:ATP synthase subunit a n=2 Tax=Candidatus Gottesmaniibacteriota TaxID=1752720 RepID=A0A1F6A3B8_9BACT|nr:MAG: ATP synthase F0 subunit A [Candidatus Gottesmanbacteria bacterium RIFCSPHIGHO2_02_FULL_39_14]OGG31642.1 MAG: ATP synthase F0 subunit A [Candidatus Gottesmanbacteria bacterium RIFCSPLOWO2_02_FULL_38_8]